MEVRGQKAGRTKHQKKFFSLHIRPNRHRVLLVLKPFRVNPVYRPAISVSTSHLDEYDNISEIFFNPDLKKNKTK